MSPEKRPPADESSRSVISLVLFVLILGGIILFMVLRFRNNAASRVGTETTEAPAPVETPTSEPATRPTATSTLVIGTAKEAVPIYSGPDTVYELIERLEKGTQMTLLERTEAGDWLKIAFDTEGEVGWVAAEFIELSSTAFDELAIATDIPPPPAPQSCPVRLTGPPDGHIFTSAEGVQLTWASPGPLEANDHYRLSFRDLDGQELEALLTTNPFSVKPANPDLVRWPRDNGEWLADVGENASYKWTVAVVRENSLLCEAEAVWTLSWQLP